MIRFSFILDSLFCLPNRCGLYNGPESFLTLGRSFDPWPVFRLLVNLLSFGQFPDSWSIVWLLFILLNLGRSSDSWSIDPDLSLTLSIGFLFNRPKESGFGVNSTLSAPTGRKHESRWLTPIRYPKLPCQPIRPVLLLKTYTSGYNFRACVLKTSLFWRPFSGI